MTKIRAPSPSYKSMQLPPLFALSRFFSTLLLLCVIPALESKAIEDLQSPTTEDENPVKLYDVSSINQRYPLNVATWSSGASIAILPVSEVTPSDSSNILQGASTYHRSSLGYNQAQQSSLQGSHNLFGLDDALPTHNVVDLLERDPTATVELPMGTRVVIVDTGSVSTLNNFKLKSFGALSHVSIETSNNPQNADAWLSLFENTLFDPTHPLDAEMRGRVARYIRITFETAQAGPVGCLRVTGKHNSHKRIHAAGGSTETEANSLLALQEQKDIISQSPPAILKTCYVTGGKLNDVKYLHDNDFTTSYKLPEGPAYIIYELNRNVKKEPIERIAFLMNLDETHPAGLIDIYAVEDLPLIKRAIEHKTTRHLDAQAVAEIENQFLQTHKPLVTIPVMPDGRASANLASPISPDYIIAHFRPSQEPQVDTTQPTKGDSAVPSNYSVNIAESYVGSKDTDKESKNSLSELLANHLSQHPLVQAAPTQVRVLTTTGG